MRIDVGEGSSAKRQVGANDTEDRESQVKAGAGDRRERCTPTVQYLARESTYCRFAWIFRILPQYKWMEIYLLDTTVNFLDSA